MEKKIDDVNNYVALPAPLPTSPGAHMNKNDKLLEAWDQLVKAFSQQEGLSGDEALTHLRKHFPELYDIYRQAKKEKQRKEGSQ
jgi:hypothetical protein